MPRLVPDTTPPADTFTIAPLSLPASDADLRALGELLADAVDSGAAVSFLAPLAPVDAAAWWREALARPHPRGALLVAREPSRAEPAGAPGAILGCVMLAPAWAPNQPHRAEVCKMIVHRRSRRRGVARALMLAVEHAAAAAGFTLLTLDAKAGGPAERLYRAMGWTCVGEIPEYALDTDGAGTHATVIFYKRLAARG